MINTLSKRQTFDVPKKGSGKSLLVSVRKFCEKRGRFLKTKTLEHFSGSFSEKEGAILVQDCCDMLRYIGRVSSGWPL